MHDERLVELCRCVPPRCISELLAHVSQWYESRSCANGGGWSTCTMRAWLRICLIEAVWSRWRTPRRHERVEKDGVRGVLWGWIDLMNGR